MFRDLWHMFYDLPMDLLNTQTFFGEPPSTFCDQADTPWRLKPVGHVLQHITGGSPTLCTQLRGSEYCI